jgi:competence protein ComEA
MRMFLSLVAAVLLVAAYPQTSAAQTRASGRAPTKSVPAAAVNINTAPASELQTLPGIGAKVAERIVEYRQKNGPFKKVEELMNVRGVGEKNFLKLKPHVSIAPAKADHNQQ